MPLAVMEVLLFGVIWLHVFISPYTKVEESFTLHAIHDIIFWGSDLPQYDHFSFPGVVPRSFFAPLWTGFAALPLARAANRLGLISTKLDLQLLIRLIIASYNGLCVLYFFRKASVVFGRPVGTTATLLTAVQFHIPFYASRPLPNMLAFGLGRPWPTNQWHPLCSYASYSTSDRNDCHS